MAAPSYLVTLSRDEDWHKGVKLVTAQMIIEKDVGHYVAGWKIKEALKAGKTFHGWKIKRCQ